MTTINCVKGFDKEIGKNYNTWTYYFLESLPKNVQKTTFQTDSPSMVKAPVQVMKRIVSSVINY